MTDEQKRVDITIRRIGEEVWLEFYQSGLRVRFEQTREEVTDLVTICQGLLANWDADTLAIAERATKLREPCAHVNQSGGKCPYPQTTGVDPYPPCAERCVVRPKQG